MSHGKAREGFFLKINEPKKVSSIILIAPYRSKLNFIVEKYNYLVHMVEKKCR
jgi:hypothetical protein